VVIIETDSNATVADSANATSAAGTTSDGTVAGTVEAVRVQRLARLESKVAALTRDLTAGLATALEVATAQAFPER
jgi:hypothetical protein